MKPLTLMLDFFRSSNTFQTNIKWGGFTINNHIVMSSFYMNNVQQKTIAQAWASPVSLPNSIQYYCKENNLLEKVTGLNTTDIVCYISIVGFTLRHVCYMPFPSHPS
jgi:hypothetical protein